MAGAEAPAIHLMSYFLTTTVLSTTVVPGTIEAVIDEVRTPLPVLSPLTVTV